MNPNGPASSTRSTAPVRPSARPNPLYPSPPLIALIVPPVLSAVVLVWMDLEMTGLDHTLDVIVEIATIVTDDELVVIAEGPDLVVHQPDDVLARMDPFVVDMHTRSGLLDAIRTSTVTLEEAGAETLAFIRAHAPEPRTVPLCGNSIGTDRRFLAAYLPDDRGPPALPLDRRVEHQGARAPLVPEGALGATAEDGQPPGARRHPGLDRRAALLPPAGVRRPADHAVGVEPTVQEARLMRAVRLNGYGGIEVLELTDVDDPRPGPEDLLIEVHGAALNRADVVQRVGGYPTRAASRATPRPRSPAWSTPVSCGPSASGSRAGHPATPRWASSPAVATPSSSSPTTAWRCPCLPGSTSPTPRRCPRCS